MYMCVLRFISIFALISTCMIRIWFVLACVCMRIPCVVITTAEARGVPFFQGAESRSATRVCFRSVMAPASNCTDVFLEATSSLWAGSGGDSASTRISGSPIPPHGVVSSRPPRHPNRGGSGTGGRPRWRQRSRRRRHRCSGAPPAQRTRQRMGRYGGPALGSIRGYIDLTVRVGRPL